MFFKISGVFASPIDVQVLLLKQIFPIVFPVWLPSKFFVLVLQLRVVLVRDVDLEFYLFYVLLYNGLWGLVSFPVEEIWELEDVEIVEYCLLDLLFIFCCKDIGILLGI